MCNNLAHFCPKSTFQRGVFVNEAPEMTTSWGGAQFFFGGGVLMGPAQKLPRFHVLEPRNIVLAAVWRHVSGFTIAHKRITEPNFIIFELFSAIPVL